MNIIEQNKKHLINGAIATGALRLLSFIDNSGILPAFVASSAISYVGLGSSYHEDKPKPMEDYNIPKHMIDHSDYMKCNNEYSHACIEI
jgi:hypothetical protein